MLEGADWRQVLERRLPGSVAQVSEDAGTFFDVDTPSLLDWRFSRTEAARVDCPILYVGGTDSGQWFAEVRALMHTWFPEAEDVVIDGADHSLAATHPAECARAVAAFIGRHSISGEA